MGGGKDADYNLYYTAIKRQRVGRTVKENGGNTNEATQLPGPNYSLRLLFARRLTSLLLHALLPEGCLPGRPPPPATVRAGQKLEVQDDVLHTAVSRLLDAASGTVLRHSCKHGRACPRALLVLACPHMHDIITLTRAEAATRCPATWLFPQRGTIPQRAGEGKRAQMESPIKS
eukprot:425334-Pyramimonas_sp.AAC.1